MQAQFGEIVAQLEKMQEEIQEDKEEHGRFVLMAYFYSETVRDRPLYMYIGQREGVGEEAGEEGEEIEFQGASGRVFKSYME